MQNTYNYQKIKLGKLRNCYHPNNNNNNYQNRDKQRSLFQQEKKILLQLSTIDYTLEKNHALSQQYKFSKGFLLSQHRPNHPQQDIKKLLNGLESCFHKKLSNVIQYGFQIEKNIYGQYNPENSESKYSSINQRLIQKSLENIREYDQKNANEYRNRKSWIKYFPNENSKKHTQNYITPKKSTLDNNNQSLEPSKYFLRKSLTGKSILPFLQERSPKKKENKDRTQRAKTEETQFKKISKNIKQKKDLQQIMKKCGKIVAVWAPPATYPQFLGMFCYTTQNLHKLISTTNLRGLNPQKKCKLTKYLFYRHILTKKLFVAILQWISTTQGQYFEVLELVTFKDMFTNIFRKQGWKLKAWTASNKVKIQFRRIET